MPQISVLVPVYNVEKYLEQCLDSICAQTMKDIEIICIDDGSTDNSGKILDNYAIADSRIRVIHKENSGYGKSMNVGLRHAEGQYIAIVESDDFVEKDMLERLYMAAQKSNADIIRGRYYRYYAGQDKLGKLHEGIPYEQNVTVEECPKLLEVAETIWTGLYKASYLKEKKIMFHETEGASFQDISFALQCWLHGGTAYFIDVPVIHYRIDNPNSSMKNPKKIFCVFDEYTWVEDLFKNVLCTDKAISDSFVATKYRDYLNHYARIGEQYQYAFLMRLEREIQEDNQNKRIERMAFSPTVWDSVDTIVKDRNLFFANTSKNKSDTRLQYCDIMNHKLYQNAFFEAMKQYQGVIVYGSGVVGKKLVAKLEKYGCKNIIFAESNKAPEKDQCMGYKVESIDALQDKKNDYIVILAVTEEKQYDMYLNLKKLEFPYILRIDEIIKKYIDS